MNKSMRILAAAVVLTAVGAVWADYEVEYTAELKDDSCIKFEDAQFYGGGSHGKTACLGEDGAIETDTFLCTVEGECDCVTVSLKAGRGKDSEETETIGLCGDGTVTFPSFTGFAVELEVCGGTYSFRVTSDDDNGTGALSHIVIIVGNTQNALAAPTVSVPTVTAPEEGPCCVARVSDYEAPTEP